MKCVRDMIRTCNQFVFKKIESEDVTKNETFYSNSKGEVIINIRGIDDVF